MLDLTILRTRVMNSKEEFLQNFFELSTRGATSFLVTRIFNSILRLGISEARSCCGFIKGNNLKSFFFLI